MRVIAALHQPLTILAADNLADVVSPDDDNANARATSIYAVVSPRSREVVSRARIAAHLTAHVPPAPCSGTPSVAAVMMLGSCFCAPRESAQQCHRRNDFTHTVVLRTKTRRMVWLTGRACRNLRLLLTLKVKAVTGVRSMPSGTVSFGSKRFRSYLAAPRFP